MFGMKSSVISMHTWILPSNTLLLFAAISSKFVGSKNWLFHYYDDDDDDDDDYYYYYYYYSL